jgi:hypothetical protein
MADPTEGDAGGEGGPDLEDLLVPITGLLSILFAVMAGASLGYAVSGPPAGYLVPVGLAAASVGSIYLKRRLR